MNLSGTYIKRYLQHYAGPSPAFWDEIWQGSPNEIDALAAQADIRLVKACVQYLPPKANILEGGCGSGSYLAYFSKCGYQVVGVDFAEKTVKRLNTLLPNLDVKMGNILQLPFADEVFDAYYSGGVIEHFEDGLEQQLCEAYRVLKKGGLFLVTVPYLNLVRQISGYVWGDRRKTDLDGRITYLEHHYGDSLPSKSKGLPPDDFIFHEYVLSAGIMQQALEQVGFKVEAEVSFSSRWGLLDVAPFRRIAGIGLSNRHWGQKIAASPLRVFDSIEKRSSPILDRLADLIGLFLGNLKLYVARKATLVGSER